MVSPASARFFLSACLPWLVVACGTDPASHADPGPDLGAASEEDLATSGIIGSGDGSPESVALTVVYDPSQHPDGTLLEPTALAWNTSRPSELWVTLRHAPEDTPCNKDTRTSCTWLWGYAAIISGADDGAPSVEVKWDENAWHFMRRPTSIAWGDGDLFATCAEARTSNYEDDPIPYNGPVLWSSDPSIFGVPAAPNSPTGSTHIDMLHESPYCMGIAHERDNVYWTFNGDAGSLDRYDFHAPHAPGEDDHSDGELWRYAAGQLSRVPNVPSHLAYDAASQILYAADTGHQRIVGLHTTTGSPGADVDTYDPIATHVGMSGAKLDVVVPPGTMAMPSGLALHQNVLFVTDPPSHRVLAFDLEGRLLRTLDVGLPGGALGAVGVSPNGVAYISDRASGRVLRIDPQ